MREQKVFSSCVNSVILYTKLVRVTTRTTVIINSQKSSFVLESLTQERYLHVTKSQHKRRSRFNDHNFIPYIDVSQSQCQTSACISLIWEYWWRRRTAGHANHSQSFNPNDYRVQIRKEPAVNRARWSHSQSKDDMFGDNVTRSLQGRPVKYNFGAKFPTDRNQTLTLYEADVTNETTRKIWFWSLAKLPTQRSYTIG